MAVHVRLRMELEEFTAFTRLPENAEKRFELIGGEVVEVPSNPFVSVIAARIITLLGMYLLQNEIEGHVTGEGGGFIIEGYVFAPDVAYVRQLPSRQGYELTPPELAVEVISDPHNNTEQTDLRRKVTHYLRAGVTVWVVDYIAQQVEVYTPDQPTVVYDVTQTLTGGEMLPSFTLAVQDIFPTEYDKQG